MAKNQNMDSHICLDIISKVGQTAFLQVEIRLKQGGGYIQDRWKTILDPGDLPILCSRQTEGRVCRLKKQTMANIGSSEETMGIISC